MTSPICRWGILGAANIARKNWKAIRMSGNSIVTAVGSRETAKAQAWIDKCQAEVPFAVAPKACSYEELLKRDDVDAVYIPLPTGIRPEWVIRAAEAGKHVLCEKPCGPSAKELRTMLDACAAKRVQFMDGVMFMHSARLPLLRQVIDDGESIGELRRVTSQFSFAASDEWLKTNIRANAKLEPLGALGDLGWYNIRFSLFAKKYELPKRATCRLLAEHEGVPMEFSGELLFADGSSASFYCSFRSELQQWAHVSGSRGAIYVSDFVLPAYGCETSFELNRPVFRVDNCRYHMENHPKRFAVSEYGDGAPDAQESNMIRNFAKLAAGGKPDPFWPEVAWKTQITLDACLRSARSKGGPVEIVA
jgi:predicted dehydrogenase